MNEQDIPGTPSAADASAPERGEVATRSLPSRVFTSAPDPHNTPLYTAHGIAIGGGPWFVNVSATESRVVGQQLIETPVVTVAYPWTLAKALYQILGETIATYEKSEGVIPLPSSFTAKVGRSE